MEKNLAEPSGRSCGSVPSSGGCSHLSRSSSRVEWALSKGKSEDGETAVMSLPPDEEAQHPTLAKGLQTVLLLHR